MINDYAGAGYCATVGENKLHHMPGRASARNSLTVPASGLVKKTASIMVALSLILGLSSTLWYSARINESLNAIGDIAAARQELASRQEQLAAQRRSLLEPENLQVAAAALGLYPPGKRQIRTP